MIPPEQHDLYDRIAELAQELATALQRPVLIQVLGADEPAAAAPEHDPIPGHALCLWCLLGVCDL